MSDGPALRSGSRSSAAPLLDLAAVGTPGGPLVVCADGDGAVWTWEPLRDVWRSRPLAYAFTGDPLAAAYPDAENEIDAVAAVVAGGRVVLAAGGAEQGPALWDLESGALIRGTDYDAPYLGAVTAVRGAAPPRFVTGSQYVGELRVWAPSAGTAPLELPSGEADIVGLAAASVAGRALAAAVGLGVDVWDLTRGERVAELDCAGEEVGAVSITRLGDRPIVAVAAGADVRVWGLSGDGAEALRAAVTGHGAPILAMDTAVVGGRPVAVTASEDGAVRMWDLVEAAPVGTPFGHGSGAVLLRTAEFRGRPVVLGTGGDGAIRVWDLAAALP
ncbi:WD40 repeat domain-containing protein [Marinitenerispora sediminis]|nr:hypothetical protein [Marinitenerispora sediminis]